MWQLAIDPAYFFSLSLRYSVTADAIADRAGRLSFFAHDINYGLGLHIIEVSLFLDKLHDACETIARTVSDSWASCSIGLCHCLASRHHLVLMFASTLANPDFRFIFHAKSG